MVCRCVDVMRSCMPLGLLHASVAAALHLPRTTHARAPTCRRLRIGLALPFRAIIHATLCRGSLGRQLQPGARPFAVAAGGPRMRNHARTHHAPPLLRPCRRLHRALDLPRRQNLARTPQGASGARQVSSPELPQLAGGKTRGATARRRHVDSGACGCGGRRGSAAQVGAMVKRW